MSTGNRSQQESTQAPRMRNDEIDRLEMVYSDRDCDTYEIREVTVGSMELYGDFLQRCDLTRIVGSF